MPVEIMLERRPYGFVPATAEAEEQARLFAAGSVVKAKITKSKSRAMLRFYWALISESADALGIGKESLSHELLCATRRVDAYECRTSKQGGITTYAVPRSIARMPADEFRNYVTEALQILFTDYIARDGKQSMIKVAEKKARVTFRTAMRELDDEIGKHGASKATGNSQEAHDSRKSSA